MIDETWFFQNAEGVGSRVWVEAIREERRDCCHCNGGEDGIVGVDADKSLGTGMSGNVGCFPNGL